jgi:hypothetical protein
MRTKLDANVTMCEWQLWMSSMNVFSMKKAFVFSFSRFQLTRVPNTLKCSSLACRTPSSAHTSWLLAG